MGQAEATPCPRTAGPGCPASRPARSAWRSRPYFPSSYRYSTNDIVRSEENTSELQSLMGISYAVFCLKKKQNKQIEQIHKNGTARKPRTQSEKRNGKNENEKSPQTMTNSHSQDIYT